MAEAAQSCRDGAAVVAIDGDAFARDGYAIVPGLLSAEMCFEYARLFESARPLPRLWRKGRAASDPKCAELAMRSELVGALRVLLGDSILLWGVDVVRRRPGQAHPWHTDIESSDAAGGFVSVWLGLENVSELSSLSLVPGSHRFGRTVQECSSRSGLERHRVTDATVLDWARQHDPGARVHRPRLVDGDALLFDGRLWHGSSNRSPTLTRSAVLLQFARGDRPVRMIDFRRLDWPFVRIDHPWPPVLAIAGSPDRSRNWLLPPPQ